VGCISGELWEVEAVALGQYKSRIIGFSVILVIGKSIVIIVVINVIIGKLSSMLSAMDCISGYRWGAEAVLLGQCGLQIVVFSALLVVAVICIFGIVVVGYVLVIGVIIVMVGKGNALMLS